MSQKRQKDRHLECSYVTKIKVSLTLTCSAVKKLLQFFYIFALRFKSIEYFPPFIAIGYSKIIYKTDYTSWT
jgi:hypothetical protein